MPSSMSVGGCCVGAAGMASPSDVVVMNRLILSNDPVAADARAARLFDFEPESVGFVKIGHRQGLGVYDTAISRQLEVAV